MGMHAACLNLSHAVEGMSVLLPALTNLIVSLFHHRLGICQHHALSRCDIAILCLYAISP